MGLRPLALASVAVLGLGWLSGPMALAAPLRIASYSPDLSRDGPGLLLRDLERKDKQIAAVVAVIAEARADVLLLTGFDWDHEGRALAAFRSRLAAAGLDYPHVFAPRPNAGVETGLDLDQDGRLGTADDKQGFGRFTGQGGMVLLSRYPLGPVVDHTGALWRDLPGNRMPKVPPEVAAVQRLSSTGHWDVTVTVAGLPLHLLAMSASPPVFGRNDRNARRNHDELAFWLQHLPEAPFVLAGKLNMDPLDSAGDPGALAAIMAKVQDTAPQSTGGAQAGAAGVNARHKGDPALDTGDWPDDKAPGNLRVDYVLPQQGLKVLDSGVIWPVEGPLAQLALTASSHRLVWVDLDWP